MRINNLLILLINAIVLLSLSACQLAPYEAAMKGDNREQTHQNRDQFRHPAETLAFFGIKPDMTVVEIWPGGKGWYTEILAPLLKDQGTLYAAHFPSIDRIPFYKRARAQFEAKLAERPDIYESVIVTSFYPPEFTGIAPEGGADAVLTFRNVHNWAKAGNAEGAFGTFFDALKPGGVLGVVEHRAKPGTDLSTQIKSGYMTEQYVIEMAEQAGFQLADRSEVNANPKDTTDHPKGVWTLPPTLRLGDQDKEQYLAIGESDRMTLKFIKPE